MTNIKSLVDKLHAISNDKRIDLLWMWIKQGVITKSQYKQLLKELK